MPKEEITKHVDDCSFDVNKFLTTDRQQESCEAIEAFVEDCDVQGYAKIAGWRTAFNCRMYNNNIGTLYICLCIFYQVLSFMYKITQNKYGIIVCYYFTPHNLSLKYN
jgi:hypothetical protein